jgi:hypothetical protein
LDLSVLNRNLSKESLAIQLILKIILKTTWLPTMLR